MTGGHVLENRWPITRWRESTSRRIPTSLAPGSLVSSARIDLLVERRQERLSARTRASSGPELPNAPPLSWREGRRLQAAPPLRRPGQPRMPAERDVGQRPPNAAAAPRSGVAKAAASAETPASAAGGAQGRP